MNENRAGLGYQNFEEVRTEHIFYFNHTPAQVWKDIEHEYDRVFLF